MPGSDGLGFLAIFNKSSELRFEAWRSELIFRTWARPVQFVDCGVRARCLGQWVESWRWTNSQHRKIVSLSPRVENLNLKKVIKVSYLNQESRQCFVFFGFLCAWTFYEHYERFIHPTKWLEKNLDGNYTRMLRAILNKSWQQHSTRHQLYGHLPPITKTIQVRRTRHAGHCWISRDELISDVLLWTTTHGYG